MPLQFFLPFCALSGVNHVKNFKTILDTEVAEIYHMHIKEPTQFVVNFIYLDYICPENSATYQRKRQQHVEKFNTSIIKNHMQ